MRQLLITLALIIELAVLGGLAALLFFGDQPGLMLWAAGVVIALAAAIGFGLPVRWSRRASLHGALICGSVIFVIPFLWLIGTSAKYPEETFIYPPRWIPEMPLAVTKSPYVVATGGPAPADVADRLWLATKPMLPAVELASVDESAARDAITRALFAEGLTGPPIAAEQVAEAWQRIYYAVAIGSIAVNDSQRRVTPIPAQRWGAFGAASREGGVIAYERDRSNFSAVTGIPAGELSQDFAGITIPIRQDRSWHRVEVEVIWKDTVYRSTDSLYLGAHGWVEWTFKLPEVNALDERAIGTWTLKRDPTPPAASFDGLRVGVRITYLPRWRAILAKYTESYRNAWRADPHWPRYLLNSTLLVALSIVGQLLSCSMVAYAFARLRWPGRDAVFLLLLATMMLPAQVTMVPTFLIFKNLGWYNTLLPLWVPSFFGSAFFIFMLRQFMKSIPRDLEEAALIDGCTWFGIYWRIILPMMRPALAAVAIFTFMGAWNEFLGPLIYLSDQRQYPLSLGLFNFRSQFGTDFGMLMAASTLLTLPVIAVFFVAQRYFIQGVTLTGMKG